MFLKTNYNVHVHVYSTMVAKFLLLVVMFLETGGRQCWCQGVVMFLR